MEWTKFEVWTDQAVRLLQWSTPSWQKSEKENQKQPYKVQILIILLSLQGVNFERR